LLGRLRCVLGNRDHRYPKRNRKQNRFHQYGSLNLGKFF
jgi:hypothetical protein